MIPAKSIKATPLALFVATVCSAQFARAQDPATTPMVEPKPTVQEQVLLRGRNRALLHPSEPLNLTGREQGENEMRSGTTALQRGNTATAGVNGDDTYRRAIAMIESRAVFTRPPTRAAIGTTGVDRETEVRTRTPKHTGAAAKNPAPASSNMPWAIGGVVAFALAVSAWLFVRNRS